jgi:transposase
MESTEKKTRGKYTKEFKLDAVKMLDSGAKNGHELEKDLGIGSGQIYRWRKQLQAEGERAFPGNGNPRDEELARLRKENAILREERDILRKAVAIFSKPQR